MNKMGVKNISLPAKTFWILLIAAAGLFAVHLGLQHLNLSYDEKHGQIFELSNRFDFDDEASVPTWFSQGLWVLTALASTLASKLSARRKDHRVWLVMSSVAVLFAIDEISGLHEFVLQSLHLLIFGADQAPTSAVNAWWLVLPPIMALGFIFIKRLYNVLNIKLWLTMVSGWLLFLAGAAGLELYGNDLARNTFYYQGVVVGLEEGLEMIGAMIVLFAVLKHLENNYSTQLAFIWKSIHADNK